jgi:hypothetical protein
MSQCYQSGMSACFKTSSLDSYLVWTPRGQYDAYLARPLCLHLWICRCIALVQYIVKDQMQNSWLHHAMNVPRRSKQATGHFNVNVHI